MFVRPSRSVPAALAAAALAFGLATLPAGADTAAPPYEPDVSSVGTVTFYDATGAVVTSGKSDGSNGAFAAYAVGSGVPRAGDPQATIIYANPDPGSTPYNWYKEAAGLYTQLPVTTGPANIRTLSQSHPVVANRSDDQTLDGFRDDSVHYTGTGYTNTIQIRIRTATAAGKVSTTYDVADVVVDPSTHTWTQVYPSPAPPVSVPGAPTGVTAKPGNAAATVSWTAPASTGGAAITGYALQKSSDAGKTWTAVTHSGTTTTQAVSGLTNGTAFVFRVAAINPAGTGAYSAPSTAVTPVADASSLTLTGTKTITYGQSVTLTGTLKDTTTNTALSAQSVTLKQRTSSTAAFTTVKTLSTSTTGVASVAVKPSATTQYQWTYAGTSTHKAASSAVGTVSVSQTSTAAANHTSVKHGSSVSVYGAVTPAVSGQKVYLQQLVGKSYKMTKTVATVKKQKLPNGKTATGFVLVVKLATKASYTYRVYVPATATRKLGYSGAVHVKAT